MDAQSIIREGIERAADTLKNDAVIPSIYEWRELTYAAGRCDPARSICSLEKCAQCFAGVLLGESTSGFLHNKDRQRFVSLAEKLQQWCED